MTKIIALAVAGLSTAAFAQTNVTIYGVADVSAQGNNVSQSLARASKPSGGAFNLKSNSSLIGFKGTEDLGNGLKGLFQMEYNVGLTGSPSGTASMNSTTGDAQWGLRDSYVGLGSKYGTVMGGYLSTPFRSTLTSFDVMPGATGDGRIESLMGKISWAGTSAFTDADTKANYTVNSSASMSSSVRATAIAYALPTLYGFNGSIAYTGSNNNGNSNTTPATATLSMTGTDAAGYTVTNKVTGQGQSALSMNLGWTGYGVNVAGAFQQAKLMVSSPAGLAIAPNGNVAALGSGATPFQGLTSYLLGVAYTGLPGLKVSAVYNRNTLGMNAMGDQGAQKGSNNSVYLGASYRYNNWEPRLSYQHQSGLSGIQGVSQTGATQWTANVGYYLSKRTQVYGLVSGIANAANAANNFASGNSVTPVAGNNLLTYGMGMRTNF